MSVQMNQYLGYGYLLPFDESRKAMEEKHIQDGSEELLDKYHDSAFKEEVVEIDGCSLIMDGMNGEYIFFGKIFKKSKVYEPMQTTVMPKVSKKIKTLVDDELIKIFGTDCGVEPAVILLTHYR